MAISPSFQLQELINKNHHWAQTYGNSDAQLKSNYTNNNDYYTNNVLIILTIMT
jgi:hypothetical protein